MKKLFRMIVWLLKLSIVPMVVWLANALIFAAANRRNTNRKEHIYEWRHGDIRYITAGKGKPLLLVHSPGGSLDEWESSLSSLSRHYKVYALDLIGFGCSDKPDLNYSSYLYVTLLNNFIRDIIGQQTDIVAAGLSAAHAVMAYSFEPGRYNKMILITPTGVGTCGNIAQRTDLYKKWLLESPLIGTTLFNILCSRVNLQCVFRDLFFFDSTKIPARTLDNCYNALHYGGSNARFAMAALLANFLHVNIEGKLSHVSIPVRVIWGENDKLNPLSNFDIIEQKNPAFGLTVFEKTGSLPHIENPKAFCRECVLFFDKA